MSAAEHKEKGNQAFKENKFEESIVHYSNAIQLAPNDHILYSNRSGAYASLGKYKEALEDSEKCITINPNFAKGYQRKGFALHYMEDYESAVEAYKAGLEKDPNNQLLKDGLKSAEGKLHSAQPNPFNDALKNPNILKLLQILQKDHRTAPFASDPTFQQLIGMMISNPQIASQFMQSDPRIQTALQVILENPEAQSIFFSEFAGKVKPTGQPNKTDAKMEEEVPEQFQQEQPKYEQPKYEAPKKQPEQAKHFDEWDVQKNLGNEEYKNKRFEKAIEHYNLAIQLKSDEPLFYNNKAAAYIELKQFDLALEACNEALKLLEEHKDFQKKAKILARKARVTHLLGNIDQAIELYEQSLIEDHVQNNKDELRKLQKIKQDLEAKAYINPEIAEQHNAHGGEFFKTGKYPDSIKEYNEAIKRNPQSAKYYCNRATAYMKLMEFQTAINDLEKCLSLDANYVKAFVKKATCHTVLKEYHKAEADFRRGLQLEPANEEMLQGLEKVRSQILVGGGTEEEQKQRASRAMQDPEIQSILREPEIVNLLNDMQKDPQNGMQALKKNPQMAAKVEKLIAAGVLRVG